MPRVKLSLPDRVSKFSQRRRRASTVEQESIPPLVPPVITGGYPEPDVKITWTCPDPPPEDVEIWNNDRESGWYYRESIEGWRDVWIDSNVITPGPFTSDYRIVFNFSYGSTGPSNEIRYLTQSSP